MPRQTGRITTAFVGICGFLLGVLTTLLALVLASADAHDVLAKWSQPASVSYGSFDPYTLAVIDHGTFWDGLSQRPTHELRIYRGDEPAYAHSIAVSFDFAGEPARDFVRRASVAWNAEGVTLTAPSSHAFFVPKAAFIFGR
jgi:hypothetical protein